jgi:hypothetical protein
MRNAARFIGLVAMVGMISATVGCRGSSGDDDDTVTPDAHVNGDGSIIDGDGSVVTPDGGLSGDVTIYDLQNPDNRVAVGAAVNLKNVVVTAIDTFGARVGSIYVQEKDGGPYSGVFVFAPQGAGKQAVGDVVTLTGGVKQEFICPVSSCPTQDMTGRTLTELGAPQGGMIVATKTGTATVPTPPVVDPVAIATDDNEAEKWEGVPVKVENVAALSNPKAVSTSAGADATFMTMNITGPLEVQSSLVALSKDGTAFVKGDCFTSITGIVDYFFSWHILPTTEADYVTGGTSCAAPENTMALCTDGMDNDHNGFTDCQDLNCQGVAGVNCTVDTSIVNIQNGTVTPNTVVKLTNVVVTAVKVQANNDRVWVADAATGAELSGVLVFKPTVTGATVADLVVGDVVDVEGKVTEFFNDTEIVGAGAGALPNITRKGTNTPPTPLVVPLATLADPTAAEKYEGVLVTATNVKVSSLNPDSAGGTTCMNNDCGDYAVSSGAATYRVGRTIFQSRDARTLNECLASVTGVIDFSFNNFKFYPRSAADVVTGGTCP